jgi:ribose transport system ATP-binding protein
MAGVYRDDGEGVLSSALGEVALAGITPADSRRLGLRFVHQNLGLIATMSIAENMALGTQFPRRGPQIRWRDLARRTSRSLEEFGVDRSPDDLVADLRPAEQTLVAVARALADRREVPEAVLVLDEPTATLPKNEVDVLFSALRASSAAGQTIVIVSHRIDEVLALTDSVTVLRDGREVVSAETATMDEHTLVTHIVGHPVAPERRSRRALGERVAAVRGLSAGPVSGVGFDVSAGEIVGLAGALGAGRSEILRALFGDFPGATGSLDTGGADTGLPSSPEDAMRRGVAYVPEDRAADAAFASLAVFENVTAANLTGYRRWGRVGTRRLRVAARALMGEFLVRAASERIDLQYLSGGNQQKVLLARWLSRSPRLLLLDEPTQGVDVGAREEIYEIIRSAVTAGTATVLVSSDHEELARFCDRVLVLRDGAVAAELTGADLDAHTITSYVQSGELQA